jgi:hypothetical protein
MTTSHLANPAYEQYSHLDDCSGSRLTNHPAAAVCLLLIVLLLLLLCRLNAQPGISIKAQP